MSDHESDDENLQQTIEQEYNTWLGNRDQIYGTIAHQELEKPHLTFQWLPGSQQLNSSTTRQQAVMGTYTEEDDEEDENDEDPTNHVLQLVEIDYNISGQRSSEDEMSGSRMRTVKTFRHEGDVNKARHMPQEPEILATISGTGNVYIYDTRKEMESNSKMANPELELKHHKDNGFGLAWSPRSAGDLATASDDGSICLWNYHVKEPKQTWQHADGVNDVDWHNFRDNLFGVVTEDKLLNLYDARTAHVVQSVQPHDEPVNSLSFNQHNEYLVLTASHDQNVALFDTRYMKDRLNTFTGHGKPVDSVQWSPFSDKVFASSARDRRVILWNISHIGEELPPEEVEDATPELSFMHGGHKNLVNDLSWNPDHDWVLASLDNECLQVWRPLDSLLGNLDIKPDDDDLEYR